jgi:replicative DNA helicase
MLDNQAPNLEVLDRVPPQDLDAERAVLGSVVLDTTILDDVAAILRPDDLYADANRRIYHHMLEMYNAERAIDIKLLATRLHDAGELDTVGGLGYLAEVVNSVAVAAHARHYAAIVAKKANYRRIIHAAYAALRDAYEADADPVDIASSLEGQLSEIVEGERSAEPVEIKDALIEMLIHVEEIAKRQKSAGVLTGLQRVDEMMGGLFPGELTILAGRPGQGKTALAGQIMEHASLHGNLCYIASLEMTRTELLLRQTCSISGVNNKLIRRGQITDRDLEMLTEAANAMSPAKMVIQDVPNQSVMDIRRTARRLKRRGLALVVVDYLQRVQPPDRKLKRYEQIGDITKGLKSLAKELKVPVLCLCMAGRGADATKRLTLADLREGGDIEAEADVVIGITPYQSLTSDEKDSIAIPFALQNVPHDSLRLLEYLKNRNSQTGLVWLGEWVPERTRFVWPNATSYSEFSDYQ